MSQALTITATVAVWMSEYHTPAELMQYIERGDGAGAVSTLTLYGPPDKKSFCDYTRMGEAEVTLRLLPRDEQVRMAVQSLNEKLDKLRAAYLQKQQEILAEISKLQALDYVEAE